MLGFTSGPGTIVDPSYIEYMNQPPGVMNGIKVIRVNEDHRLFLQGEFGNFRIYYLVTHTRVEVLPDTVEQISSTHFKALIKLELSSNEVTEHLVVFRSPILPFSGVWASNYGLFPDSFNFRVASGSESFPCDLTFLLQQAENSPLIQLKVEYKGIAKSDKREAQDRLGEGHEKLQKLLIGQNRRQSRQTTSIVLYRPSELIPPILTFKDVLEVIEATMIQYFKPQPLNIQRLNFPHDSPRLYEKVRSISTRAITTKITSPNGTALYSGSISPKETHNTFISL